MTLDIRKIVSLYSNFYRAGKKLSARKTTQPIVEALDIICASDSTRTPESLIQQINERLTALMKQIHAETAQGRWVTSNYQDEQAAIQEFSSYVVNEVFYKSFGGDVERLQGTQQGFLVNTCEYLYLDAHMKA